MLSMLSASATFCPTTAAFCPAAARAASSSAMMTVPDVKPIVGDMGFDPLNLGSEENFGFMREAEIKHGRIAMLAAVAWPMQEIFHPIIVDAMRNYDIAQGWTGEKVTDVLVESGGASPSLLNGGLGQDQVFPALVLFFCGSAALEEADLNTRKSMGLSWNGFAKDGNFGRQPGDFRFDPLSIYTPLPIEERVKMQERELTNGRVAMLAVASYVAEEFFFDTTTVQFTPGLFEPLVVTPWFRAFMDSSFGTASMDGSINGVAF